MWIAFHVTSLVAEIKAGRRKLKSSKQVTYVTRTQATHLPHDSSAFGTQGQVTQQIKHGLQYWQVRVQFTTAAILKLAVYFVTEFDQTVNKGTPTLNSTADTPWNGRAARDKCWCWEKKNKRDW